MSRNSKNTAKKKSKKIEAAQLEEAKIEPDIEAKWTRLSKFFPRSLNYLLDKDFSTSPLKQTWPTSCKDAQDYQD
jgi:hypothetical protein